MGARGYKPLRRQRATAQIEELIRREELWGRRLPGERELAAELGVSRGTLQRALEALEAKGVLVRRHGSGTFAAERGEAERKRSWEGARAAVLAARENSPAGGWSYYGDMIKGIMRGARRLEMGAGLLPLEKIWDRAPGPEWARLREFDAFLVIERDDPALMTALLKLRRGPVVILDSNFRDIPVIGVVDGSFAGARRAVSYLLRLGHRRIAYVPPGETPEKPHEKTQGYRAALAEAGVPFDENLVAGAAFKDAAARTRAAVGRFLALEDPPTALFAGEDDRALAALEELEKRGRRVGEDFALIGFGDSAFRHGLTDRLSSVRIYTRQMGEAAVRAAVETRELSEARTLIIPDRLVVRQTSCRPRAAVAKGGAK